MAPGAYDRIAYLTSGANARHRSYAHTERLIASDLRLPIALLQFNAETIRAWQAQWGYPRERVQGGWDWATLGTRYMRLPDAFHLAMWYGTRLCGLAVGTPSSSRRTLTLDFIEGAPDVTHPLKGHVLDIGLETATFYGGALGATTLRLRNPDSGLLNRYQTRHGFSAVVVSRGVRYCERRIPYG